VPDVFISYSRPDGEFVHRLHAALQKDGKDVWVDFEDIAPASPWAAEVKSAIENSDAFVFVISPESVASPQCLTELERAAALNKRIVPLHFRETDPKAMPDPLSAHNWVPQIGLFDDQFEAAVATLVRAIETDLDWVKGHTRWGQKAGEWEQHERDRRFLLSGAELEAAEAWLAGQAGKQPPPTDAQTNLVLRSRQAATRRLRRTRAAVVGALVITVALAVVAVIQRQAAIANERTAQSRELAARAQATLASDPASSVQLSLQALDTRYTDQAEAALRASLPRVQLQRIVAAGRPLYAAAFSPGGKRFVTAATNGRLRIWDAGSGSLLKTERVRPAQSGTVDFGHGSVVTAGGDKNARLWHIHSDAPVTKLASDKRVTHAAFSDDGRLVVTASQDGEARIWSTATGNELAKTRGVDQGPLTAAAFSPGGGQIVTGDTDGVIRTWDADSGKPTGVVGQQSRPVGDVEFSRDGMEVVTAGLDFKARIWDAEHRGPPKVVLDGHTGSVHSAAFNPNDTRVVTASADGTARIWDADTGEQLNTLSGHGGPVFTAAFNPNANGTVVTSSSDQTARIWDAASDEARTTLRGRGRGGVVNAAAFSPDGNRVATASKGGRVRIWNPARRNTPVRTLHAHAGSVNTVAYSPNGEEIVTASQHGEAKIWDAVRGRKPVERLSGDGQPVYDAEFSRHGEEVVTAGRDGTVKIWNADNGSEMETLPGPHEVVNSAAFSPNAKEVVAAYRDGKARIWNVADREQIQTLEGHSGPVEDAEFSPDGKEVVTASGDRTVRIWDAGSGDQLRTLGGHTGPVYTAAFSRHGTKVVTASADGTARIWDPATGRQLTALGGFSQRLNAAAFSPDGKKVVTASPDGATTIWSTALSGPLYELERTARERLAQFGNADPTIP
jgi:WD40 repeat protein